MSTYLNLSLTYQKKSIDLRLPKTMTVGRLLKEMSLLFQWEGEVTSKQIYVPNKGLVLELDQRLSRYAIESGDLLEIEEMSDDHTTLLSEAF